MEEIHKVQAHIEISVNYYEFGYSMPYTPTPFFFIYMASVTFFSHTQKNKTK
jgi:hypothetical protein